jgi:GxxExxY protein
MEHTEIEELNGITEKIIGLAIAVHKKLGPGFIERIYQEALSLELDQSKINYEKEKFITINYKGRNLGEQRIDFLIENSIILEIKAIDKIGPIHIAQVISYLKAMNKKLGLILNFSEVKLGIKRIIF